MNYTKLIPALAVSESGFVFLPTTGETFNVNEQGRMALSALQNGHSDEEIIASLAEEFDADATLIRRDYEDFLAQLRQYQLLKDE